MYLQTTLIAIAASLAILPGRMQPEPTTPAEPDPTAAAALMQADRAFAAMSEADGTRAAFAEFLRADAIQLANGGPTIEGRERIVDAIAANVTLTWEPRHAEVAASGELGWTWGVYDAVIDGEVVGQGKYMNIWKREGDGPWRVAADMGNGGQ